MTSNSILLDPDAVGGIPELHQVHRKDTRGRRSLGSHDDYESFLVDKNGNEYEPYSLAWRYLGLYIDCDIDGESDYFYGGRGLHEEEGEDCERKLLWAAYHDTRYKGNNIEEYQFYDLHTEEWDDSACVASGNRHRCARMDCHEPHSHFQLVGVFKETDGMYDFTEQLFKHEGYCVWQGEDDDEDTYETMETWMENWPTSCNQLTLPDYYGNTIYIAVHPLPEGNMTLGIYMDEQCTQFSPETDLSSYIVRLYSYYGYSDRGYEVAESYSQAIETWNEKMSTFKVCQPCRAYNLFAEQSNSNSHSNDRRRGRLLGGDDTDGEGEEQERFNCYDDAGYTNVDQCYKFETHTSLEMAEVEDLSLASAQGSILRIKSNGKVYGEGGYVSPMSKATQITYISIAALGAFGLGAFIFFVRKHLQNTSLKPRKKRVMPSSLRETFYGGDDDVGGNLESETRDNLYKPVEVGTIAANDITGNGEREIEIGPINPAPQSTPSYTPPTNESSDMTWNQLAEVPTADTDEENGPDAQAKLSPIQENAQACLSATNKLIDKWQNFALDETNVGPSQADSTIETAVTSCSDTAAQAPVPETDPSIQSSLRLADAEASKAELRAALDNLHKSFDEDTTIHPNSSIPHIGTVVEAETTGNGSMDLAESYEPHLSASKSADIPHIGTIVEAETVEDGA